MIKKEFMKYTKSGLGLSQTNRIMIPYKGGNRENNKNFWGQAFATKGDFVTISSKNGVISKLKVGTVVNDNALGAPIPTYDIQITNTNNVITQRNPYYIFVLTPEQYTELTGIKVETTPFKTLWESPAKSQGVPFLTVKSWKDSYVFSERLGVDSVAFIILKNGKFGLTKEFKPPIDDYLTTAFGGSIDKNIPYKEIVQQECIEEAGIEVGVGDIHYIGEYFVSTQSNQFCKLYLVDAMFGKDVPRAPENEMEALATVEWLSAKELLETKDWKSIVIWSLSIEKGLI